MRRQSQFSYGIGRVNMIVNIFTIKICGMVNEITISTYEIVNLRTILIFVGKKKLFLRNEGGVLKMSTWF